MMKINWKKIAYLKEELGCSMKKGIVGRLFCIIHHFFIPHKHNSHYPHSVRPKALLTYSFALIGLKIIITGILFITLPSKGFLSQEIINKVYALTNIARAEAGVVELTLNDDLMNAAQLKANDMVEKSYFSHYTPEGYPPWFFIDTNIYPYDIAGENIAMNFTSAETVHKAFLASPSHRQNILDARFTEVGFAVAHGEINGDQTQLLVEIFGNRLDIAAAVIEAPDDSKDPIDEVVKLTTLYKETPPPAPTAVAGILRAADNYQYSEELLIFSNEKDFESLPIRLYRWSNYLFMFFLSFLLISLAVNLIIRIRIQHGHLMVQTLLVILLVTGLLYIRIHFIEGIPLELSIN